MYGRLRGFKVSVLFSILSSIDFYQVSRSIIFIINTSVDIISNQLLFCSPYLHSQLHCYFLLLWLPPKKLLLRPTPMVLLLTILTNCTGRKRPMLKLLNLLLLILLKKLLMLLLSIMTSLIVQ